MLWPVDIFYVSIVFFWLFILVMVAKIIISIEKLWNLELTKLHPNPVVARNGVIAVLLLSHFCSITLTHFVRFYREGHPRLTASQLPNIYLGFYKPKSGIHLFMGVIGRMLAQCYWVKVYRE